MNVFTKSEISEHVAQRPISELLQGVVLEGGKTYVSQIFDALYKLIAQVDLLPGQLISEKEVADTLTASKTPVREALIRLEDAGLVNIVPKSGTYVTPIDMGRYVEACFVRLRLETGAVRRSAQLGSDVDKAALKELMAQQERTYADKDFKAFFHLDEALHRSFFEIGGVPGVWSTVKRIQIDMDRIRQLKRLHGIRRGEQVIQQHWDIVNALQEGSARAAETALVEHLGSLEHEVEALAQHPALLEHIEQLNSRKSGSRARRG